MQSRRVEVRQVGGILRLRLRCRADVGADDVCLLLERQGTSTDQLESQEKPDLTR